ncbi:MAG: DUF6298 domain-containing protein [Candidatus Sumerlaeia bacterium]
MSNAERIQPCKDDPRYWQYKSEKVLLLGGSKEDNLFQIPDLEEHLDLLQSCGGNYIRCTMSSRDEGDVWPFEKDPDTGKYDLSKPGQEYWRRFEKLLDLCEERNIILQIELWDRFDFARAPWQENAFNPKNNINYTETESGLKENIETHPGQCENAFFRTLPEMENNTLVLPIQQAYVDHLLCLSLERPNVLYCMNNETSEPHAWGIYWINWIQNRAKEKDALVFVTDMFDDGFKGEDSETYPYIFDHPEIYTFGDISQINSRNFREIHWLKAEYMVREFRRHVRPVNMVKIYGGGHAFHGSGFNKDGVERMIRALMNGVAAARFHRPTSGNGLNERAQNCIRALRLVEEQVKFWDLSPRMDLLVDRLEEVYACASKDGAIMLYFPHGASIDVNLAGYPGARRLQWFSVEQGNADREEKLEGGQKVKITAPSVSDWIAVIRSY